MLSIPEVMEFGNYCRKHFFVEQGVEAILAQDHYFTEVCVTERKNVSNENRIFEDALLRGTKTPNYIKFIFSDKIVLHMYRAEYLYLSVKLLLAQWTYTSEENIYFKLLSYCKSLPLYFACLHCPAINLLVTQIASVILIIVLCCIIVDQVITYQCRQNPLQKKNSLLIGC